MITHTFVQRVLVKEGSNDQLAYSFRLDYQLQVSPNT